MVTSKTSTVAVTGGEHLFRVVGHSKIPGDNASVRSETFRVGIHDWAVDYYPNGDTRVVDGQFSSVFLTLMSACESEFRASFSFCLQDPATQGTGQKNKFNYSNVLLCSLMPESQKSWGVIRFVSKADLAASGCLQDDCLVIKCTIDFSKLVNDAGEDKDDIGSIIVPPSNLSEDLHSMLGSGLKEDLTVNIGLSRSFKAHACVLRARSPVFRAQLCASLMESSIHIEDVDAEVFEALLHYMYKDCLPAFMEETTEKATKIAQQLLVVADQYKVERLKNMCESKLSKVIDVSIAGYVLDLAEQCNCVQLKNWCLKYMATDRERLQAIRGTEGFKQLQKNYPLVVFDILDQVTYRLPRKKIKLSAD
ncbi:unnamed protein product [Alopecurus aequalis]